MTRVLKVGVKVLLRNPEGKILLLKRSSKYRAVEGSWDIPGGRIETGSSLMENLAREVREEAGLTVRGVPRLVAAQDIFPKDDPDQHIVRLTYVGEAEGETALDGVEHTEHRWVPFGELGALPGLDNYLRELLADGRLTETAWT